MIQQRVKPATSLAPLPEIDVPTATAIVSLKDDPATVLIGRSLKHTFPVLPGGKIDRGDLVLSIQEAALHCICRELPEEIGTRPEKITLLFVHNDPTRDVRIVSVKQLRETIVGDSLREYADDELVSARYGIPDFVFVGSVGREEVRPSEELRKVEWLNLRSEALPPLSAGHDKILSRYLSSLREDS